MGNSYLLKRFMLDSRHIAELSNTYHHIYFRDLDAKLISCNDLMVNFFGYSNYLDLIDLPYDEIITNPKFLQQVLDLDNAVLKTESTKISNESIYLKNKEKILISIKSPLYNENHLIGLCGVSVRLDNQNYSDFMSLLSIVSKILQIDYAKSNPLQHFIKPSRPKLTQREMDCLFLYLRGYTLKNVAEKLGLSARTIEFYIENIKSKLGVNKRSELLSLAFKIYPEFT